MTKKPQQIVNNVKLEKIVGGGRAIGTLEDGCKVFVWGGLPDEVVDATVTKKKARLIEGVVTKIVKSSKDRVEPLDQNSYLSTSPWQIMKFEKEQFYKSALIEEAFEMQNIVLPNQIEVYTDNIQTKYRNKIELSWYWNKDLEQLDLAFFNRGTHSKVPVEGTCLAKNCINEAALVVRNILRKRQTHAFDLKTLLIRCDQNDNVTMQLYVKNKDFSVFSAQELNDLNNYGFEIIYSNPKSPASVITKRLQKYNKTTLSDKILGISFNYSAESFFQINLPVYEQAIRDIKMWVNNSNSVVDLYSGVGTIGLTTGGKNITLVEINESAVDEMKQNISSLKLDKIAKAILSPSEKALDYISKDATIIVDPPRAGLHESIINKLLEVSPSRIIYLSCNPITQARDVALLAKKYGIKHHMGYNFFPRTPHIENLIVLDLKS